MGQGPIRIARRGAEDVITFAEALGRGPLKQEERLLRDLLVRDVFFAAEFTRDPAVDSKPQPGGASPGGAIRSTLSLGRVRPGDLITAGFINGLVDAILALDGRLLALEDRPQPTPAPTPAPTPTPSPPEPRDELRIDTATAGIVQSRRTVTVTVTGTGLAPQGLRSVTMGQQNISVTEITGGNARIRFSMTLAQARLASSLLTITSADGSSAEADVTVRTGTSPFGDDR